MPLQCRKRLTLIDLIDSSEVPAALKLRRKPYFDDLECVLLADGALAEGQAVAVVMRAVPDRDLLGPAKAAAYALHAVGDDGLAVARAAQHDAPFKLAPGHGFSDRPDEIRIVTGCVGSRPEVADGVPFGEKHGLDLLLVGETGVIRADGDGEFLHEERKWGETVGDCSCRYSGPPYLQQPFSPSCAPSALFFPC